jgi:hypothetical protein
MSRRLPLVLSLTALVIAVLGSTSAGYALVSAVAPGSVGTPQLKNGAVTAPKLRGGAVTSAKVRNGTLLRVDFKAGQLVAGPRGAAGPTGPAGPAGPQGAQGARGIGLDTSNWRQNAHSVAANSTAVLFGNCQAGERAYAGGFAAHTDIRVRFSSPDSLPVATRWRVDVTNTAAVARSTTVYVLCVPNP